MLVACYILPLTLIIYEDFKYRAIHWFWLLLLTGLVLSLGNWQPASALINLVFIAFQLTVLSIYFSIKNKRLTNIVNSYLGIGDVLFFIPLCFLFSPVNLIGFFVVSLLVSITGVLLFNIFKPGVLQNIPLAGCMTLVLIPILLLAWHFQLDLKNDTFLLQILS